MKRFFKLSLFVSIILLTFSITLCATNTIIDDNQSTPIGVNDLMILSNVEKVLEYGNVKNLSERAAEQVTLANESYLEGVKFLQQDKISEAVAAFKSAFKNYKRAKLSESALNFPNVQLAIAHALSKEARDQKKVSRYMELFTKDIYKEKEWAYNVAILNYITGNETTAAELLEGVIKKDKYFFKAYGNLAAVYQTINEPKKSTKTLNRLEIAQEMLAEKERKAQLAAAKQKEKNSGKPIATKTSKPEGVFPDATSLVAFGDAKSVMKNESIAAFDDRTRKKLKEGQGLYQEGVELFNQGEFDLAIKSFKSSLKKYTQAKVSQATLNYIIANLAMSYLRSPNDRNRKKVGPLLEGLSKEIYKERDWVYNIAVMQYELGNISRSVELLHSCTDMDEYFLFGYQNQIALYNQLKDDKNVMKSFKLHEKYKRELTEIYKEYVRTGVKNDKVNLDFLEGAVFRISLGTFNEYSLPIDIYLHEEILTIPLGEDFYSFICGNYDNFLSAEKYLQKLEARGYEDAHIIAFKDGKRTDFSND